MTPNPTIIKTEYNQKFTKVYAGLNHSMAISNLNFVVYTWGQGTSGQLGSKRDKIFIPTVIEVLEKIQIVNGLVTYFLKMKH